MPRHDPHLIRTSRAAHVLHNLNRTPPRTRSEREACHVSAYLLSYLVRRGARHRYPCATLSRLRARAHAGPASVGSVPYVRSLLPVRELGSYPTTGQLRRSSSSLSRAACASRSSSPSSWRRRRPRRRRSSSFWDKHRPPRHPSSSLVPLLHPMAHCCSRCSRLRCHRRCCWRSRLLPPPCKRRNCAREGAEQSKEQMFRLAMVQIRWQGED